MSLFSVKLQAVGFKRCWENSNISRLQHQNGLKYTAFKSHMKSYKPCECNVGFMSKLLFIHFKRGHFVLAHFFLGHPVLVFNFHIDYSSRPYKISLRCMDVIVFISIVFTNQILRIIYLWRITNVVENVVKQYYKSFIIRTWNNITLPIM